MKTCSSVVISNEIFESHLMLIYSEQMKKMEANVYNWCPSMISEISMPTCSVQKISKFHVLELVFYQINERIFIHHNTVDAINYTHKYIYTCKWQQ